MSRAITIPLIGQPSGPASWSADLLRAGFRGESHPMAVPLGELIDAAGIDGRMVGACRTWPGFTALRINECWIESSNHQAQHGPLLVGPGIDHAQPAFTVQYTGGAATATIRILENAIILREGSSTVLTILPSPLQTVDQVVTAINGLADWTATGSGTDLSYWLDIDPAVDVKTSPVTVNRVVWRHCPIGLRKGGGEPKFFKPIEFRAGTSSNKLIAGWVILLPYLGPEYVSGTFDMGLPAVPSFTWRYVVAFLYWDEENYQHPASSEALRGPGWRLRILSNTEVASDEMNTADMAEFRLDCTAWGQYGYIVCPEMLQTPTPGDPLVQAWGSPDRVTDGDGATGPAVLYYDTDVNYVKIRPMGQQFTSANRPLYAMGTVVGFEPRWATLATAGPHGDFGAPASADESPNGRIFTPDQSLQFNVAVSFFDTRTQIRSEVYMDRSMTAIAGERGWAYAGIQIHTDAWSLYNRIELWRSFPGNPGVLYREHSIDLGTLPAENSDYNDTTDRRVFWVTWGVESVADVEGFLPSGLVGANPWPREDFIEQGLHNFSLTQQTVYEGIWDYTAPPPSDASRIVVNDDISYLTSGYSPPGAFAGRDLVPARLRWSSAAVPRPENFTEVNNAWYPDEKAGLIYGMTRVGNSVFISGTRSTIQVLPNGDRLVFGEVGDHLVAVNRYAVTSSGNSYFVLTPKGLYVAYEGSREVQPVQEVSWLFDAAEAWGAKLAATQEQDLRISLAYDNVADALFIHDEVGLETIVLWRKTGSVTRLLGSNWKFSASGTVPVLANGLSKGYARRACFFSERNSGLRSGSSANYRLIDIFHPTIGSPLENQFLVSGTDNHYTSHGAVKMGGSDYKFRPLRGTITVINAVSGNLYFEADVGFTPTAEQLVELNTRFGGSMVGVQRTFTPQLQWVTLSEITNPSGTTLRYYYADGIPNPLASDAVGGGFIVAPIYVRMMFGWPMVGGGNGSDLFTTKTLYGGDLVLRGVDQPGVRLVDVASGGLAVGDAGYLASVHAVEPSYSNASRSVKSSSTSWTVIAEPNQTFNVKRLGTGASSYVSVPLNFLPGSASWSLPASGARITYALDLLLQGVQLDFIAVRMAGSVVASTRR